MVNGQFQQNLPQQTPLLGGHLSIKDTRVLSQDCHFKMTIQTYFCNQDITQLVCVYPHDVLNTWSAKRT
jgi:hypothetical protein